MAEPSFPPYNVGDLGAGVQRQAPAAARNVGPIGDVLADWLPSRAGARNRQRDRRACAGLCTALPRPRLAAERSRSGGAGIDRGVARGRTVKPSAACRYRHLDPTNGRSTKRTRSCASTWSISARGKLRSACSMERRRLLGPVRSLILYGPWIEAAVQTAPSNLAFDQSLQSRDPRLGTAAGRGFRRGSGVTRARPCRTAGDALQQHHAALRSHPDLRR